MTAYRKDGSIEKPASTANGIAMLMLLLALVAVEVAGLVVMRKAFLVPAVVISLAITFIACGFFMLQPNEAGVLTLFGDYVGTERRPGLRWTMPWNMRRKVSVRTRNHNVDMLKVNDKRGNPRGSAAVVGWRAEDASRAVCDGDGDERFGKVQSEPGRRHVSTRYDGDGGGHHAPEDGTLRGGADVVADALRAEVQLR